MNRSKGNIDKIKVLMLRNEALENSISKHLTNIQNKSSWHMPFGVFASFLSAWISILMSDKTIGTPEHWLDSKYLVLYITAAFFLLWAVWLYYQNYKHKSAKDLFIDDVVSNVINMPNTTYLFIITRFVNGNVEFLVSFHSTRKCYFLPYQKQNFDNKGHEIIQDQVELSNALSNRFDLQNGDFDLENCTHIFKVFENKYFPDEQLTRTVYFNLNIVNIKSTNVKNKLNNLNQVFKKINSIDYEWKTLEDMEQDNNTYENNKTLINYLKANNTQILNYLRHIN